MDAEERGIIIGELKGGFQSVNARLDSHEKRLDRIEKRLEARFSFKWVLKAIIAFFIGKHGA